MGLLRFTPALLTTFLLLSESSLAQSVDDYVTIGPPQSWIVEIAAPDLDETVEEGRDLNVALIDYQTRFDSQTDVYFTHMTKDLLTSAGVDSNGSLSIDFKPEHETITLHHVKLLRDGKTIDALDLSEALIFRSETDRNQMIFNGSMTFYLPILDLRIGDRLDYAYSFSGRNPAIGKGFLSRRSFDRTSAVQRLHYRVNIPSDIPVYSKSINDPVPPRIEMQGADTVYIWDSPDPAVSDHNDNIPPWAYTRPTFELSPFESWADVGNLFAGYYRIDDDDRAVLEPIVKTIQSEHETPAEQARAAVDWVQQNIRYVAVNMGEGGFVPRDISRILKRRFGDCKDVTTLLLGLLDGLGVEADPVLVDMEERGGEFDGLPHPYAFDHVIVVASLEGQIYPMDATRDPQLGTLETMEKVDMRKGLRLREGASEVIDLPQQDYPFFQKLIDRYDLVSEAETISYSLVMQEYGDEADGTRNWIARDGLEAVQNDYVEYFQDHHPTLRVVEPMTFEVDDAAAMTTIKIGFELDRPEGKLSTKAYQVLGAMPDFQGGTRSAPFSIDHPKKVVHRREYVVDDSYDFNENTESFETDSFSFDLKDLMEGDTLFVEEYSWATKRDYIAADTFESEMQDIDKIIDLNYTTLNLASASDATDTAYITLDWKQLMPLFLVLVVIGFFVWRNMKSTRLDVSQS